MKLWKAYLRDRLTVIAAVLVTCGIFAGVMLLYGMPPASVLYPILLCVFLSTAALAVGVVRYRDTARSLEKVVQLSFPLLSEGLPEPNTYAEEQYQILISSLCSQASEAEENYHRREQARSDYDTAWAHQIKTPIASMRLRLQGEDTPQSRALSAELLRIEQYVEMVLAYQRLDSSTTDFLFRPCQVDNVIRQTLKRLAGSFILRGIRLSYEPTGVTAVTDEKWLSFVLEQILSNALKYTPEGTVTISLSGPDTLCIRDTGIGIAPEDLPRIFERGYTGINGRQDHRATGIGLYLCKRILAALNHDIEVQSEPGKGTAVYLSFAQNRRLE